MTVRQIRNEQLLTRDGQVTDRYTAEVTNLGDDNEEVRLGGLYALQRIAQDSTRDAPTVVQVISAYVRSHSPLPKNDTTTPDRPTNDVVALSILTTPLGAARGVPASGIGRQLDGSRGLTAVNASYCSEVTWISLLAALVGAVIAMGSALLVERRRTQRETIADWHRTRRELYARFLASHAQAGSDLRNIAATGGLEESERYRQARTAYTHCYASRHEVELLAPRTVVDPAGKCSSAVREMRDAVSAGSLVDGEPFLELTRRYLDLRLETLLAMRADIASWHM
ncbi:hypothetical protein [Streptomyces sp. NPDC051561]|uniref:hypothetical protein n=1 Tax=Streptomyces sp. NPDC051561 TaxID=3365658 RepID=UPI0037A5A09D